MYLAEVFAENFRLFGPRPSEADSADYSLRIAMTQGINALVGENDSGKTAIIDAIRFCLWTTSQDYHRFTDDDFHCSATGRAVNMIIRCKFVDLSLDDQATFFEWLTAPQGEPPCLFITTTARRIPNDKNRRIEVRTHSGPNGEGPALEGLPRELLRTTYLRPLRDAENELRPGRNSRLSRILASHPKILKEDLDDFNVKDDTASTLVGIVRRADHHISKSPAIKGARNEINDDYLLH